MPVKEYKAEKMFYTMGEIMEMFDVKASLVRFWVERFDILKPKKNKKGNRLFTPGDVKNFETIYHLTRERGMTLTGVEKYLKNNREGAERDAEIVRRLQTIRGVLVEIREELREEPAGGDTVSFIVGSAFEAEDEPAAEPPDAEEFAEEELPGEVVGEKPEPDAEFETAEDGVNGEGEEEEREEDLFDAEVSEPFTAQSLFEVEERIDLFSGEAAETADEVSQESKPEAVDTQQSLF